MEQFEGICEGEWSYLTEMYTAEEAEFMAHLLTNSCVPNESGGSFDFGVQSFWPSHESTFTNASAINHCSYYCTDVGDSSKFFCFPQGTSSSGSRSPENYSYLVGGNDCNMESGPDREKPDFPGENFQTIADNETPVLRSSAEDKSNKEMSAKRERPSTEMPKCKKNVKSRKNPKASASSNGEENASTKRKSSSSYCSEDESNASQELNGESPSSFSPTEAAATNLTGKTRASRGAATDPQSLYARKRRERINERLRILQTLVPNGTKVDISTMLEEAVEYVKFLQLQIKLLSSDDLWMYAPIACNGMAAGLDLEVIPPRKLP